MLSDRGLIRIRRIFELDIGVECMDDVRDRNVFPDDRISLVFFVSFGRLDSLIVRSP